MPSLFGVRRVDEPGSGGKMLRGRRRRPPALPYLRPENSPSPLLSPPENPSWFSGIISGAGRLLSSVFHSDSGGSSSSGSDSDGSVSDSSDEEGNVDASFEGIDELEQTRRKSDSCKTLGNAPQPTAEKNERKLAIEKLLMQETFTRDECNRLTKIIQSRVVDHLTAECGEAGVHKELPSKPICGDRFLSGAWRSVNQESRLRETLPYSSCHLNDLSLGSSILRAYTPELHNTAIMEARKWLDEKKSASSSKSELDRGPCTLNTDVLHRGTEDEVGSPVDMAKSYMRGLPPWQSPILSSIGFKTPSHTSMHLSKDKTPYAIGDYSLPSFKTLKRSWLATELDEIGIMHMTSAKNISEPFIPKQVDSSARMLEQEAHQTLPAADQMVVGELGTNHDSNSLPTMEATKSVDASSRFPGKLSMKNDCSDGILNSPDERTVEVSHSMNHEVNNETNKLHSANNSSKPEKATNEATRSHESSVQTTLPSGTEIEMGTFTSSPEPPDFLIVNKNQDVEEASQMKGKTSVSVPHESHSLDLSTVDHNDARYFVEGLLNLEQEAVDLEDKTSFPSKADGATDLTNIHASSEQRYSESTMIIQDHKSSQDPLPEPDEGRSDADPRLQDGNGPTKKEANRLLSGFTANGGSSFQSSSSVDPPIHSLDKGGHNSTNSSNDELAAGMPEATCECSSDVPTDFSIGHKANNIITDKPENGTAVKQMSAENPPKSTRGRGRRAVAKPGRGRGRGK